MAGVETQRTSTLEVDVKSPLEVSVSKHALPRLSAYSNEARTYLDTIREFIFVGNPQLKTPFADVVATDADNARKRVEIFLGIEEGLKKGKNVEIEPQIRTQGPPDIFLRLPNIWIIAHFGVMENLIEVLYPLSKARNEIRKEPAYIRDALESGRKVILLSPKTKSTK